MAYFWKRLRSGEWLTASRARGYSLILLGVCAIAVIGWIAWLWQSDAAFDLKASALATTSLLATPYVLDYDLVVLAVSIAFFARHGQTHGFRDYEISVLAAAWIMPLLSRGLTGVTGIPPGLIVLLAFYGFTLHRAMPDRSGFIVGAGSVAQA
jgi:alpha-1,2-mannosyltransferase